LKLTFSQGELIWILDGDKITQQLTNIVKLEAIAYQNTHFVGISTLEITHYWIKEGTDFEAPASLIIIKPII